MLQALQGAANMGLALGCYLAILKWRGPAASISTQTRWDQAIPFLPEWLYVYLVPYLVGPPLLGLLRRATFAWYIRRGLLILGISLAIFAVVPTRTVRPSVHGLDDSLTGRFYLRMVTVDEPPANAAPSLHVSLTCLLALALLRDFPRWWPAILVGVALVCLATLFTWQHHLLDVATGALLGLMTGMIPLRWGAHSSVTDRSV
jgi:membrane-associated phospholipid phosphatase